MFALSSFSITTTVSSSLSLFKSPLAERIDFQPFGINPSIFFDLSGKFSPKAKIEQIKNNDKINSNLLCMNNAPFLSFPFLF